MARQVNSFSELLQSTFPENQIFEGLDEIFQPNTFNTPDSSVLNMLEQTTQPIAPASASNAIVPYVNPEPAPARSAPLRIIFDQHQNQALQDFIMKYPKPTNMQKLELGEQIGLTLAQITSWVVRKRTQKNAQTTRQQFYSQQKRKIDDLHNQLRQYQEAFTKITCPNCGNHVTPNIEQQLRIEGAPPQLEIHQIPSSISPREKSHKGKDVMDFSSDPVHSSSTHTPSSVMKRPVQEQTSVMTDRVLVSQIRKAVIDELITMATAEKPLWISAPQSNPIMHQEFLCEAEYKRVFTKGIDLKPKGFQCESSRYTATIPITPIALVNILMEVDQWSSMFCSIISRARTIDVLSIGTPGSYNHTAQLMTAEFQVTIPYIPTRVTQFVRYCHQQTEESWVIVDVSVDSLSSRLDPHTRSQCQKRPSGCFIQGLTDGNSHVVWVEHVDVNDQYIYRNYRSLMESGIAFGARRWMEVLQRQVERSLYAAAVTNPSSDFWVTLTVDGRKNLLQLAHTIMSHFCADIGNSTTHDWIVAEQTRYGGSKIKVSTNKIRDRPNKPPGLTRTAAATFSHLASHSRLFDFLRDVHLRNQWDHLSKDKSVQEVVHITTGHDARNCVSLLQIEDTFILQECCTDSTGSYIVYAPIDILTIQTLLGGFDPDPFILLVSGFSILPDMHGHGRTEVYPGNPPLRCLVTIGTQISTELLPKKRGLVSHGCQLVQNTVKRIQDAVL